MSDTPRTDSVIRTAEDAASSRRPDTAVAIARLSQQLERELAEEKKLSSAISLDCNNTALERNQLRADLARVSAERDTLQKWREIIEATLKTAGEKLDSVTTENKLNRTLLDRAQIEAHKLGEELDRVTAERDAALADATRWRKHCDVMRRGDVSLLVRVLFDITAEEYARTLDSMKERDDG